MWLIGYLLQYAEWFALGLLSVLSAARYVNPADYPEPVQAILKFLAGRSFALILWLSIGIFLMRIVNQQLLERSASFNQVKSVLDSLHKNYFKDVPQEELFQHRATLFKAKKYVLGRLRYLEIFARSGTTFQKSATYFKINDEHESKNEGIAGWAWFTNAMPTVTDLAEWPANPNPNMQEDPVAEEYAKKGKLSVEKASVLNVKSRSVTAIPVRSSSGKKWGVLVVDSRNPNGISTASDKKALVELSADILTQIV